MEYKDDAYEVLGVEPTATEAEIKKSYRKVRRSQKIVEVRHV